MIPIAFVYPEFLWGLAACAIPLVVHFLNRRRLRRLDFSTLRFFPSAAVQTSRIRRLKRWLLLCVRMALLCTLVAIFARPYPTRDPFAVLRNPDAAVFAFVDPTVSMNYRENGAPLWRTACDLLDTLDRTLPPAAKRFEYNEARAEFLPVKKFSRPAGSFTRHGPAPLHKMIAALAAMRGRTAGMPLLVCMSDFQENVSAVLDTQLAQCGDMPVLLGSVAPALAWNCGVRDVIASAANRSVVTARVWCAGRGMHAAGVTVTAGGMRVGHAITNADPGQSVVVPVSVTSDLPNPGRTVVIDSDDPFPDDNTFYFVQGASGALRVLVVGDPAECFPVSAAFSALGSSQWNPVVRPGSAVTYDDLDSAALVILCGVRRLSPQLARFVHGASQGKKAVLFSPVLDSADAHANDVLLPAQAAGSLRPVFDAKPHAILFPDTVSSLFSGFGSLRNADAEVNSYCAGLKGAVLMRLDNSAPFATHIIDTMGNSWVLLSVPIGVAAGSAPIPGSLFERGLYVPLLDRLARYALSAIQKEPQSWIAGTAARNPYFGAQRGANVFDAAGRDIMRWSNQPLIVFDTPGLYRIQPDGDMGSWVSVNMDTSEVNLTYRAPHIGPSQTSRVQFLPAGQFGPFVGQRRPGAFSRWLWIIVGLLVVAEVLLWEKKAPPAIR